MTVIQKQKIHSFSTEEKAKKDPLIQDFLAYIDSEKGLAANTKKAYQKDIESLFLFLYKEQKNSTDEPISATKSCCNWPPHYEDILSFMRHLHEKNLEASSQARKLIAIKVFMRFLFREEYITKNIAELLESPKLWQTLPAVLGYNEIEQIIRATDIQTAEGIRDRAIFEVLYGTGLRVSELCSLSIYDISDDIVRVQGKGGKERLIPIGQKAIKAVDSYLLSVRSQFDSEKEEALFVSSKGARITRELVWKRVKFYSAKIGLTKEISPHTFRHTYASHLLDSGADLRVIQELLGHAHISSTDKYTHLSKSQIQEVFYTFHPRWDAPSCHKLNKKREKK